MSVFGTGLTPTQHYAELNRIRTRIYDAVSYGAIGDDNTDNTTVLSGLITIVSAAGGGWIFFPIGTYKTHTLTLPANVGLLGVFYYDNYIQANWQVSNGSVLKSISAEPLINSLFVNPSRPVGLENICLDGNNIGTEAYVLQLGDGFYLRGVHISRFAQKGVHLKSSLVGTFEGCWLWDNYISVYVESVTVGSYEIKSNLIRFKDCSINYNTKLAIYFSGSSSLIIEGTSIETNGTLGDTTTGAIYYNGESGGSAGQYNMGLIIKGGWFESTIGGPVIEIADGAIGQLSSISDTWFMSNTGNVTIKVSGTSRNNKLVLRASSIMDSASLLIDGQYAKVVNDNSNIVGSVSKTNSGKYYTADVTEV